MENNIGNVISQYRQASKMTQEEFALRLGVTAQAVSKWERNQGMPDVSLLAGICQILDISAGTLLGVGEKVAQNPYEKIIDDVVETCDKNYAMILNKNLVKIMIDNVAEQFPGVVEDIIPSRLSIFQIEQELKRLVKEGKSIRDMIGILEEMEMKLQK